MTVIYRYVPADLDNMKFNKWAWQLKSRKEIRKFKKYLELAQAFTLYDETKDKPVAVLAFHEYGEGMYYACIIASEDFGKNPKYAAKMKYLSRCLMRDFHMEYVQTKSEDAPELNRWHEFLGFKPEKKLPNHRRGKTFIIWSM